MKILCLAICGLLFRGVYSISKPYEGDQVWSVKPKTEEELRFIANLINTPQYQLDPWKDPRTVNRDVNFRVPFAEIPTINQILHRRGLSYKVMISDVQHLIDSQTATRGNRRATNRATNIHDFDYSVYHPADEIYDWIDFVANEFPHVTKFRVGVTSEGRAIYGLNISTTTGATPKKAIYVDALIHCREWITTATTIWAFKEMLTKPEYSSMLDDYDWYFIPMINIDGYVHTWADARLWRKTRSATATSGCVGVDGNRNWDVNWGGGGASPRPCDLTYHGPFPHSEPEVRHLSHFILEKNDTIQVLLSVHSYSQLLLYPYNYALNTYAENDQQLHDIAKAVCDAMFAVHGKEYIYGPGAETIYVASGVTMDWAKKVANIEVSYTYELRDTGEFGFLLPEDQIIPNGEEFLAGLVVLVEVAQQPVVSGYGPN